MLDGMDEDTAAEWSAVRRGEQPATWSIVDDAVRWSAVLTDPGRDAVRSAVEWLQGLFDDDWLAANAAEAGGLMALLAPSPANPAAHAYMRVLRLGSCLALQGGAAWGPLRERVQRDPGSWQGALLTLEVAGLALRDGWSFEFEGLLRLARDARQLLVECASVSVEADRLRVDRFNDTLFEYVRWAEVAWNVSIAGTLLHAVDGERLRDLVSRIEIASSAAARSERPVRVDDEAVDLTATPRQDTWRAGGTLTGAGEAVDTWDHLARALEETAARTADAGGRVWIRVDATLAMWHMTAASALARDAMHAALADLVVGPVDRVHHVAGVVLSLDPIVRPNFDDRRHVLLGGRGIGLVAHGAAGRQREAVVVAAHDRQAREDLLAWDAWYSQEASWLDWALRRLGMPGTDALIVTHPDRKTAT